MEHPFLLEARDHRAQADLNGRLAFRMFFGAVAAFGISTWYTSGLMELFYGATIAFTTRMIFALDARFFHRNAARMALSFYECSQGRG